jgi:hypothetical protein
MDKRDKLMDFNILIQKCTEFEVIEHYISTFNRKKEPYKMIFISF